MKKVVLLITSLLYVVFAYAQASTENIGGLLYSIDTEAKTATLIANDGDEYEGDIVIPEKVKTGRQVFWKLSDKKCNYPEYGEIFRRWVFHIMYLEPYN